MWSTKIIGLCSIKTSIGRGRHRRRRWRWGDPQSDPSGVTDDVPRTGSTIRAAPVLITFLVFVGCALPWWLEPVTVNHDVGWYVYAAGKLVDGARLYVDVIDVNPPLVLYLTAPPVALAHWLGWPDVLTYHNYVLLLAGISIIVVNQLLCRFAELQRPWRRHAYLWVLTYLLTIFPGDDFGQREHLLAIVLLPYVLTVALRQTGAPVRPLTAAALGVFAGGGLALKPYFLLGPALLLIWVVARTRRVREVCSPENLGVAAVLLAYGLHFLVLPADVAAGFRQTLGTVLQTYGAFKIELVELLQEPLLWLGVGLAALALTCLSGTMRCLSTPLALSSLGLLLGSVLQQKGWSYHFLPAEVLGWSIVTMAVLGLIERSSRGRPRVEMLAMAGCMVVFLGIAVMDVTARVERRHGDKKLVRQGQELAELAGGGAVMVLDTRLFPHFPRFNYTDLHWTFRFCSMWPLPGIYNDVEATPGQGRFPYNTVEQRGAAESFLADAVIEDLRRHEPALVLVKQPPLGHMRHRNFHLIKWLRKDRRFRKIWRRYAFDKPYRGMRLYRLRKD